MRDGTDSQRQPTASASTSASTSQQCQDEGASDLAPRRQLRERSSVSAHRPRPALTSSARGIAKLEVRRQKEREANEAFARANAAVLEQRSLSLTGGSDAVEEASQACTSSQTSKMDYVNDRAGTPHEEPERVESDHRSSQLQKGSSQSDFFASPRSRPSQSYSEQVAHVNATNEADRAGADEQVAYNGAAHVEQSADLMVAPVVDPGHANYDVHADGQGSNDALQDDTRGQHVDTSASEPRQRSEERSEERSVQPPRKKPRTFVEPEDEFDDDDDHGFFEALAECDFEHGQEYFRSESNGSPAKRLHAIEAPKPLRNAAGLNGSLFKRANDKPILFKSSAMQAQIERFKRELEDSDSSDLSHDRVLIKVENEELPSTEVEDSASLTTGPESATGLAVDTRAATEDAVATDTPERRFPVPPSPFRDRTNQTITPLEADKEAGAASTSLPFSSPLKEAVQHRLVATPVPLDRSSTYSTPQSSSSKPHLARRLGAGRLSTPNVARASTGSPLKTSLTLLSGARNGRVSLGNTMLRKRPATPGFKSPFKSDVIAQSQREIGPYGSVSQTPSSSRARSNVPTSEGRSAKIFDLSYNGTRPRKTLLEAITLVECTSSGFVRGWMDDACEDIITILSCPKAARRFAFSIAHDETASVEEAREYLGHVLDCEPQSIPLAWVRNHFGLIVWKLAALVRHIASPDTIWSYEEVCRQLCYRYEREVHMAHRSAVKRIQERDSSASRSMVLCVYGMDTLDEQLLTLTDGWYLIEAVIDEPLRRAITKGTIKLGSKLFVTKGILTGETEPEEPLKAFELSFLKINGNAVKLARWDARLGFSKCTPIATARSLTSDGGVVPLMDVVVTKVYPMAYIEDRSSFKSSGEQSFTEDAWSAEEEEERRRKWYDSREEAEHGLDDVVMQKTARLESLLSLVLAACEDAGIAPSDSTSDIDPSSCEGMLDAMITSSDPGSYLRMQELLLPLRLLAEQRLQRLRDEARFEAVNNLNEACPERVVRTFCQIRVCDTALASEHGIASHGVTQQGQISDKLKRCRRTTQIRYWNVGALSTDDRPKEGQRFLITDLVPTKKNQWPRTPDEADEIHLATTQSSKWIRKPW